MSHEVNQKVFEKVWEDTQHLRVPFSVFSQGPSAEEMSDEEFAKFDPMHFDDPGVEVMEDGDNE